MLKTLTNLIAEGEYLDALGFIFFIPGAILHEFLCDLKIEAVICNDELDSKIFAVTGPVFYGSILLLFFYWKFGKRKN
ncbi:hypothetical protein CSB37_04035 [bacterium DOLZORAL124_38_8]|nr:MAG: hypothetical protein CSB37_04035 [bacterium DOLZORAL124_38_8]